MGHTTQLIHFLAITKLELSYDYIQTDWLKIAIISSWNKLTCLLNPLYPRLICTKLSGIGHVVLLDYQMMSMHFTFIFS